jgi:hypothetical protein
LDSENKVNQKLQDAGTALIDGDGNISKITIGLPISKQQITVPLETGFKHDFIKTQFVLHARILEQILDKSCS